MNSYSIGPMRTFTKIEQKRILIFSDLHLGAIRSNTSAILTILKKEKYDMIIILGDLFDGKRLERLKRKHWAVLAKLRKVSKHKKIIYIVGNHCFLPARAMGMLLGLDCRNTYSIECNGTRIHLTHGDEFDFWCSRSPLFTQLGTYIKNKLDIIHLHKLSNWMDNWLSSSKTIRFLALKKAQLIGADWIVCGHTHQPEISKGYSQFWCSG